MRVKLTWTNDIGQLGAVTLDVDTSQRHHLGALVTDHPIELGPNVADFVRAEPYVLDIEGTISNTPILLPADNIDGAREITVSVEGARPTVGSAFGRVVPIAGALLASRPLGIPGPSATVRGFVGEFDRVIAVYRALDEARQRGWLLSVHTRLKVYENMAPTSMDFLLDETTGDAVGLSLSLKQLFIANVELVEVPEIPTAERKTGNKPAKVDDAPAVPERQRSALSSMFGS